MSAIEFDCSVSSVQISVVQRRLAVVISCFFDESSEGDSKRGLLGIAGYVFDDSGLQQLTTEWRAMLKTYNLPYFHMTECNSNSGVFGHLSAEQCDLCAREAIRIVRTHPLHGRCVIVDQTNYRFVLQEHGFGCDPYTFMMWVLWVQVNKWANENAPSEKISLCFESGYKSEKTASMLLSLLHEDSWNGKNRVVSATFKKKQESEPTQAADLRSWHYRKGFENSKRSHPVRRDTIALDQNRTNYSTLLNVKELTSLREGFVSVAGSLQQATSRLFSTEIIQQF